MSTTLTKEGTADRYEARKQRLGWYTDKPTVLEEGTRVKIDAPLSGNHDKTGTVLWSSETCPRQVIVALATGEQIVTSTPALAVLT